MKKIITLLSLIISLKAISQPITLRTRGEITPLDSNLIVGKNLIIPIFNDTTQANTFKAIDSSGRLIFTRNPGTIWYRKNRKWYDFNAKDTTIAGYLLSTQLPNILNVDSSALDSTIRAIVGMNSPNMLISTGGITLTGNTVTILANITWKYNNILNVRTTNFATTINSATVGKYRKDIIYINNIGTFIKLEGVEDDEVGLAPTVPSGGLLVSTIDIFGSTITSPSINTIFQRRGVVYVDPITGTLKTDSVQFNYDELNTILRVGAARPIGTQSSVSINSERFTLTGSFNGGILNVGSGSAPGVRDLSKSISFQNRGNNYLKLSSETNVDHTADFFDTKIKNVPPITTNTDSVAVWENGILKKAALTIGSGGGPYTFGNGVTGYGNVLKLADTLNHGTHLFIPSDNTLFTTSFSIDAINSDNDQSLTFNSLTPAYGSSVNLSNRKVGFGLNKFTANIDNASISSQNLSTFQTYSFGTNINGNNSIISNNLEIKGNTLIVDLPSKGTGKILTSDAVGNATWETPLSGGGTTKYTTNGYGTLVDSTSNLYTVRADTAVTAKLRDAAINSKLDATAARVVSLTRSVDSNLLVTYASGVVDTFKIYGSGGSGGGSTDTTSLSNRINAKQNIAPTTQIITSGTTATINDATNWVIINPSTALGTLTITLPANPTAGEIKFNFGGTITGTSTVVNNLVIVANSGQTLVNTGTIGLADAEDNFGIRINSSNWYRQ